MRSVSPLISVAPLHSVEATSIFLEKVQSMLDWLSYRTELMNKSASLATVHILEFLIWTLTTTIPAHFAVLWWNSASLSSGTTQQRAPYSSTSRCHGNSGLCAAPQYPRSIPSALFWRIVMLFCMEIKRRITSMCRYRMGSLIIILTKRICLK